MSAGHAARVFNGLFPLPRILRVNRRIAICPAPRVLDELWETAGALDPDGRAAARDMYSDDTARLRRLEDKLTEQLKVAAPLLTVVVAVGSAAVQRSPLFAVPLAAVAALYVAAAAYLASHATRATATAMPQPSHLRPTDPERPLHEYTYEQLRAVSHNAPRSVQLANAIYGAQRCLFLAAILILAASFILLVGVFEPTSPSPAPTPSPSPGP